MTKNGAPGRQSIALKIALACALVVGASAVAAVKLEVSPGASVWMHLGAYILLYSHIGGGAVGLVAGATAIASRKAGPIHRKAGKVFLVSMFIAYLIGAFVAPFLSEGQRPNFVAAVLALYLLITGVMTARRRHFQASIMEKIGLAVALLVTGMGVLFAYMAANSVSGTVDGSPPQAFVIFIVAGSIAAAEEIYVLVRRKLSDVARKIRHLWRMCFSLFLASGSLFLGQPQVFPDWFNGSILPGLLALAPVLIMLGWVSKILLGRRMAAFLG